MKMGFFKDFKDDFSEAVNDLVPGAEELDTEDTATDTLDEEIDVQSELSKLDGLLEQVTKRVDGTPEEAAPATAKQENTVEDTVTMEAREVVNEPVREVAPAVNVTPNPVVAPSTPVDDETAVITAGMTIKGDIESTGSVDVKGGIEGNITCNGKLVVTGVVHGNSTSSEFFADAAKIEGEVNTSGTAKIGVGSVIIGNITATSAVIAGAVKGDIDVQGPVVVDTSAVVMGNIKSRSVQINNGAVIEGFCSQCYADVDVEGLFA